MNRDDWVRRTEEEEEDDDVEDEVDDIPQTAVDEALDALDILNYILVPQFSSTANVLLGLAGIQEEEERRALQEAFRTLPYARPVVRRLSPSSSTPPLRPMNPQSRKRLREMR